MKSKQGGALGGLISLMVATIAIIIILTLFIIASSTIRGFTFLTSTEEGEVRLFTGTAIGIYQEQLQLAYQELLKQRIEHARIMYHLPITRAEVITYA